MPVIGFDETINIRLRNHEKLAITQIVKDNDHLFDNESHFIRSAILSFIKNFKKENEEVIKNEKTKNEDSETVPSGWFSRSEENRKGLF